MINFEKFNFQMQPSTIFKSDRFRLFDIGSLSWRPAEFVEILVTEIPGSWSVSETVLRKKESLISTTRDNLCLVPHLSVIVVPVLPPLQL